MTAVIDARRPSALPASPRACSSITRSSRLETNVTPLALIAWRSHGASSQALSARRASGGRVREHVGERRDSRQRAGAANRRDRIVEIEELARRGRDAGEIVELPS